MGISESPFYTSFLPLSLLYSHITNRSLEVDIPSKPVHRGKKVLEKHFGFAFVQFETKEDADRAIEEYNGKEFKGRSIYARKAVPPPTEEEKQKKIEAYKVKQEAIKAEKAAAKKAEIEVLKAANGEAKPPKAPKKKKEKTEKPDTEARPEKKGPSGEPRIPEGIKSTDTIFVTNLEYKVDVQALNTLFKDLRPKWVHVPSRKVPQHILQRQKKKGRAVYNKGIAFVKFASEEVQKQAVEEFNGRELNGRNIVVDIAVDRVPKENAQENSEDNSEETPEVEAVSE